MKKLIAILACILCAGSLFGVSACGSGKIEIGVLQYAEHSSLDNCFEGVKLGLAEKGYGEDKVHFSFYNAKGSDSDNTFMAGTLVNLSPKAIVAIATPSAYAAATSADGSIPIVYTAVSDPKAAKMDEFKNVTGSSDKLPLASQLELIKSFFPNKETVKIGILYSLKEQNSVSQIAELKSIQADYGVEIIARGINEVTEISGATDALLDTDKVDCMNNLTDNSVVQNLATILERAKARKVPVFGSEIEQVKKGCLASCSIEYVELGKKTGYMLAQILSGEKTADELEVLFIDEFELVYNSGVLADLGLTLSDDYKDKATDVK